MKNADNISSMKWISLFFMIILCSIPFCAMAQDTDIADNYSLSGQNDNSESQTMDESDDAGIISTNQNTEPANDAETEPPYEEIQSSYIDNSTNKEADIEIPEAEKHTDNQEIPEVPYITANPEEPAGYNLAESTDDAVEIQQILPINQRTNYSFVDLGIGYGGIIGIDLQLSYGYIFKRNFSLVFDFNYAFGLLSVFDIAVVPRFQFFIDSFRVSVGMGVGLLHYEAESSVNKEHKTQGIGFELKPELQLDWFTGDQLYIGLGAEWQVGFGVCVRHSDGEEIISVLPYLAALDFHVGYTF